MYTVPHTNITRPMFRLRCIIYGGWFGILRCVIAVIIYTILPWSCVTVPLVSYYPQIAFWLMLRVCGISAGIGFLAGISTAGLLLHALMHTPQVTEKRATRLAQGVAIALIIIVHLLMWQGTHMQLNDLGSSINLWYVAIVGLPSLIFLALSGVSGRDLLSTIKGWLYDAGVPHV